MNRKFHFPRVQWNTFHCTLCECNCTIIIYRPGARGIRRKLPSVLIFPSGLCGESINDILYRKLKASKLRIKNLTHTFVNTMFYFRINASIVAFLSNHISFGISMTTFFKICFNILKKTQVLHHLTRLFITHQYYLYFIIFVMLLWVYIHTGRAWKICPATVGIEPTTFGILAQCSANWATWSGRFEYVIFRNRI